MEYKNLHSYKNFINKNFINKNKNEELNEGIFSGLMNMFKNMKQFLSKIKGGEKVDKLYTEFLTNMNKKFIEQYEIDMKLPEIMQNYDQLIAKPKPGEEEKQGEQKPGEQQKPGEEVKERLYLKYNDFLNEIKLGDAVQEPAAGEGGDEPAKEGEQGQNEFEVFAEVFKKNRKNIANFMGLEWKKVYKKMNDILKSTGGGEKNPKLKDLIEDKREDMTGSVAFKGQPVVLDYVENYFNTKAGLTISASVLKSIKDNEKIQKKRMEEMKKGISNITLKVKGKDREINIAVPYRYNAGDEIKTIKIIRKSDDPKNVIASYSYGDSAGEEQEFKIDNVELDFKPKIGEEYKVFSELVSQLLKVDAFSDKEAEFYTVKVKTDKTGPNGKIKITYGDKNIDGEVFPGCLVGGDGAQEETQTEYEVGKIYKCKTDSNGEVAVVVVSIKDGKTLVQRLTEPNTVDKPMTLADLEGIAPFEPKSELEPLEVDQAAFKEILDDLEGQLK